MTAAVKNNLKAMLRSSGLENPPMVNREDRSLRAANAVSICGDDAALGLSDADPGRS
jgi:hypothetical protein